MAFEIEKYENHLLPIRRQLLDRLCKENWDIVTVVDEKNDWCIDDIWKIESTRRNYGITIDLWFFKYDGEHDGMNNVVAWPENVVDEPKPYGGGIRLDLKRRRYEKDLQSFLDSLNRYRLTGTIERQ